MTMKTYLALALLITVLAGNAYGEDEIYYCADNGSAGFNFNKNAGSYQMERGGIVLSKFKIKLDLANKRIVMATDDRGKVQFTCKNPVYFLSSLSCTTQFDMFNINPDNGRYVFSQGIGYVNGDHDSVTG